MEIPLAVIRLGVTGLKKNQARVPPRPVWGKKGDGAVRFSVCGAPLDDWANCGYVDVLFTCGECSFSSFGSWSANSNFLPPFSFRNSEKKKKKKKKKNRARCSYLRRKKFRFTFWNKGNLVILKEDFNH